MDFDPMNMPGTYSENYSSTQSSSTQQSVLSDEEIALRLVEMHARDSRDRSLESLVKNYFHALSLIKNKSSETTTQTSQQASFEPRETDERDMISDREYMSDADVDSINPSEIL